ncbi:MAG TPA: glycosyltransferase family 4 protein [Vicinamibacterales bacterium]
MRVLVIAPTPFFGDRGCHVRIYEEVRALAALGIDTLVTTYPTGRDLPDVRTWRATPVPGFRARELGPSYGRVVLDGSLLAATIRAARSYRPHILHAHLHEGILLGHIVRRTAWRVPLVADLQGGLRAELTDHGFVGSDGVGARALERFERWLVRRPDLLVVSSSAADAWLESLGVGDAAIERIPDGVDLDVFHPAPPDPALVARYGLQGKRVIVFLGVLTPYQGVDLLLESVPAVIAAVPDAHFLLMGYPYVEEYQAKVNAMGLARHVTLTGRVPYDEACAHLNLGTLAVSAKQSLTEANGKLLNYMACGVPVVATDTAVNRELLGDAGRYVPLGSSAALASAMVELLGNEDDRRRRGAQLRARAEAEFAWSAAGRRLAAAYDRLLPQQKPRTVTAGAIE